LAIHMVDCLILDRAKYCSIVTCPGGKSGPCAAPGAAERLEPGGRAGAGGRATEAEKCGAIAPALRWKSLRSNDIRTRQICSLRLVEGIEAALGMPIGLRCARLQVPREAPVYDDACERRRAGQYPRGGRLDAQCARLTPPAREQYCLD